MRETVERILEPRALWGVGRRAANASDPIGTGRVELDPTNFRNGGRHTLVLTHLLVAPINYLLQRNDDAAAKNASNFDDSGSILNRMRIFVQTPGIYRWQTEDLHPVALTPVPIEQPPMEFSSLSYASSPFGLHRWDFDFEAPFWLPRKARIQFDVSGWGNPAALPASVTSAFISAVFTELPMEGFANRLPQTARLMERRSLLPAATTAVFPAGPTPFQPDGFGASVVAGGANSMWFHIFPSNVWDRQESNRGSTHSAYSGFAVAIDQMTYEDSVTAQGAFAGMPVTALANRVACRARTTNGGSEEWWWRPGCPLSLVCPTVGTALVFKYEKPIVLAPGDALDVEVQAPGLDPTVTQTYQLGVSTLGYARIEA